MSILNYFLIGFVFTFIIDLLLGMAHIKNHITMKGQKWGMKERITCILIWPLSALIFSFSLFRSFFKR